MMKRIPARLPVLGSIGTRITGVALVIAALLLPAAWPSAALAAGETPVRIPDQAVYDLADIFDSDVEDSAESLIASLGSATSADIVVVSEAVETGMTTSDAVTWAGGLHDAMNVGRDKAGGGLLVYFGIDESDCHGQIQLFADDTFAAMVPNDVRQAIFEQEMAPLLAQCDLGNALLVGLGRVAATSLGGDAGTGSTGKGSGGSDPTLPRFLPAGPPFPEPANGVAVYDYAGVFAPTTVASVERTIDAIEERTGAEVVVYSQVVEGGVTTTQADAHAQALMDQWGVGRKGFDDGLVILFDLDETRAHGQVILYGGPGYRAAYLDNGEKQRVFDEDMLPRLRSGDLDGALLIAIQRVDANATPEHAANLQRARQLDAALGLIGGPVAFLGLSGAALWSWRRYGRDPVYLDDPSIHMAGPPADLTAATATFVLAGGPSRRALTAALLDLASRGVLAFREESMIFGLNRKIGLVLQPPKPDPETLARQLRNDARPLGPAEDYAARHLEALDGEGEERYVEPDELLKFGASVAGFDEALERHAVAKGWFRERPSAAVARWRIRGGIAVVLGIVGVIAGFNIPSNGRLLLVTGLAIGGWVVLAMASFMPAVSLPGAMIRAMLAAYRRTLKKTMDQARSMDQVVAESGLDWLETPDQAVVWATALGLHDEIEGVIGRSLEDQREGRVSPGAVWMPAWYGSQGGGSAFADGGIGGGGGSLFSSSAVPDLGGMMSALGSIGNSPGGSGGGGGGSGGGFGGGGSGGGGGGSGGGF
jgi:uncharacterized membrane protein YgcG